MEAIQAGNLELTGLASAGVWGVSRDATADCKTEV